MLSILLFFVLVNYFLLFVLYFNACSDHIAKNYTHAINFFNEFEYATQVFPFYERDG